MNPYQTSPHQSSQAFNYFFATCVILIVAVLAAAFTYHIGYLDGYIDGGGPPGPHYKINPNAR